MIGEKLQKIIVLLDGNSSLDEGKFLIGWRENWSSDIIFILILVFFYLVGEEKLILTDYFILIFVGLTEELRKDYSCSSIFSDGERRAQQSWDKSKTDAL